MIFGGNVSRHGLWFSEFSFGQLIIPFCAEDHPGFQVFEWQTAPGVIFRAIRLLD